ncbi:chemotaxis protein CheX [Proteiniborus ethanoligenes]|uniref:Chemotaxis protein CheX n=1 Tax=Proteiniborus ethanoligenes TaxID=415015 RepID=A0A1H3RML2_9FIRM|nr:hypothetical protein [Proteiniborus ethanoligenes]SDZ26481.1 chemotaxis protein CheX [Proteiniborus ethanoligenes]
MIRDTDIVKTFNKNAIEIFKQVIHIDLNDGRVSLDSEIIFYDGVIVVVALSGVISGQIMINISEELAKLICLKLMGGVPVVNIDRDAKKDIFSLCKLIIGNSCASLYENGVSMNVTSYGIIQGRDFDYMVLDRKATIITYEDLSEKMGMIILLNTKEK